MRIVRSVLSPDLTRCPIETRRKKKFRKRRKNKKRGWNRWKFFPYLFLLLLLACAVSVCWCPSFSDYRRSMRVSTCVCVCIIALSHGLTWFLNERRRGPPPLSSFFDSNLLKSCLIFFEKFLLIFLSVRGLGDWHLCIASHHPGVWASGVYSAIWRNGRFRWPCLAFFFLSRLVM
jgi:hypothetical protein